MRWLVASVLIMVSACEESSPVPIASSDMCADVVEVRVEQEPDGTYRFDVTVSSTETGWDKYADAWEVRAPDGSVLATRVLTHPHVDEQPFTRSQGGVSIPVGVDEVEVAAHDLVEGFCGDTMQVPIR